MIVVVGVHGHGAVTFPPPRNAVDRNLSPWNSDVPVPAPFDGEQCFHLFVPPPKPDRLHACVQSASLSRNRACGSGRQSVR